MQGKIMYLFSLTFLGEFAKLRNKTISFLMSANPSICPNATNRLSLQDFREILYIKICGKPVEKITSTSHEDL